MRVLITGASSGIGHSCAEIFLARGHDVIGIDIMPSAINARRGYRHITRDISDDLPDISGIEILVCSAGTDDEERAIAVNLTATIAVCERYAADNPDIKSVVNIASTSAHSGAELPLYTASKGGLLAYTKNLAGRLAERYRATCNSVSPGAVETLMNRAFLEKRELYDTVSAESLLGKWASADEVAELIYYLSVINKSITAQDIIIDNGEEARRNFIRPT